MTLSRKGVREITGLTFAKIESDPENWIGRGRAFKDAAELLAKSDEYSPPIPFYYNSGVALELVLKAIAIAKSIKFETTHRLNDLCKLIGLTRFIHEVHRKRHCNSVLAPWKQDCGVDFRENGGQGPLKWV